MRIALIDDQVIAIKAYSTMLLKTGAAIEGEDEIFPFQTLDEFDNYCETIGEMERLDRESHRKGIELNPPFVCDFDVIICDHNLGRNQRNGYSFLFHLQENGFDNLAILLTGDDSEEMRLKMQHTPSIVYVIKGGRGEENSYVVLKTLLDSCRAEISKKKAPPSQKSA
jgi:CheY-like chemotaxis protein